MSLGHILSVTMAQAHLEGEGQAHGIEAEQAHAPDHCLEVLREAAAAGPQARHHRGGRLKAEPVQALQHAACARRPPLLRKRLLVQGCHQATEGSTWR